MQTRHLGASCTPTSLPTQPGLEMCGWKAARLCEVKPVLSESESRHCFEAMSRKHESESAARRKQLLWHCLIGIKEDRTWQPCVECSVAPESLPAWMSSNGVKHCCRVVAAGGWWWRPASQPDSCDGGRSSGDWSHEVDVVCASGVWTLAHHGFRWCLILSFNGGRSLG